MSPIHISTTVDAQGDGCEGSGDMYVVEEDAVRPTTMAPLHGGHHNHIVQNHIFLRQPPNWGQCDICIMTMTITQDKDILMYTWLCHHTSQSCIDVDLMIICAKCVI